MAREYLLDRKKVLSNDPSWYSTMLAISVSGGVERDIFFDVLNEGLDRYPTYYSLYLLSLDYMSPQWNNFTSKEIDDVAQMMLEKRAINDAEGLENFLYKL